MCVKLDRIGDSWARWGADVPFEDEKAGRYWLSPSGEHLGYDPNVPAPNPNLPTPLSVPPATTQTSYRFPSGPNNGSQPTGSPGTRAETQAAQSDAPPHNLGCTMGLSCIRSARRTSET